MITLPCASCNRPLKLPDNFPSGALIRCPLCKATFPVPAPAAAPAEVEPIVEEIPDVDPIAEPERPRRRRHEEDGYRKADHRLVEALKRAAAAARYLWLMVVFGVLLELLLAARWFLSDDSGGSPRGRYGPDYDRSYAAGQVLGWIFIALYVAGLLVAALGARAFSGRRSYALAMVGAICALVTSLGTLILTAILVLACTAALTLDKLDLALVPGAAALLGLLGILFGVLGGVRALAALNNRDVVRLFS
jgi:LSD1 subclass zinc finger protein